MKAEKESCLRQGGCTHPYLQGQRQLCPGPPASAGCSAGAGVHPKIVLAELSLATAHQSAIKKVTCASTHVGFRASAQTNASQSDQGVRRSFMKLGVSGLKETGFGKYSNSP